jgi:hypothetical protein
MTDQPKTKTQYVVISDLGGIRGPFDSHQAAAAWARAKWPDQNEATPDTNGQSGWRVAVMQSPDEA